MNFKGFSNLRPHRYLGMTQSLCPDCLGLVQAKIIERDNRVYFQKHCPEHGSREDFVCSDSRWFDRTDFNVPGRLPIQFGLEPNRGCPYDCGLCTQHEQHTCVAVLEITDSCNLTCPMCYASSSPGRSHLSVEECQAAIDRLVKMEGQAEILQLSGGEPTVHPEFEQVFEYACQQAVDHVMVNTNGIRLGKDPKLVELLARHEEKSHVYLQMDGLIDRVYPLLRGESLLETKLKAIERLGESGIHTTLVATLQPGVNLDQVGQLVQFAKDRDWITGLSLQPATYVGRSFQPDDLETRITFPDILREIEKQTSGLIREDDFFPVPCAHPNAHTLCYSYRSNGSLVPITRFVDIQKHQDLLANGISLTREQARVIVEAYLARESCGVECGESIVNMSNGHASPTATDSENRQREEIAASFFSEAVAREISANDMFRITTTSFMDVYNFDIRQLVKSCVHHVLPTGHIIPFDAYNLLYRDGHVSLPTLPQEVSETIA